MKSEISMDTAQTKHKLPRWTIFVMLLALVSVSCVCGTENLPDFITNLIDKEGEQEPSQSETTNEGVLFSDDFSDPASGWEVADYDTGSVGYTQGKYFVTSTEPGSAMWGVAGKNYADVMIEVDATQVSAPSNSNNDYGIMCRLDFAGNGYTFNISGDGFYSIQKMVDNEFVDLVEWAESNKIRTGNATNHIVAICHGQTLALFVNGTKLAEVNDSTYTTGDIGLAATTYETQSTEIQFDNIIVRKP